MARSRERFITGLQDLSFVEQLSSRFEIPPRTMVFLCLGAAVVLLVCACWMGISQVQPLTLETQDTTSASARSALEQPPTEFDPVSTTPAVDTTVAAPQAVVVYLTGAVANPGLYTLSSDDRIGDAVEAAGGLTPEATLAVVNLAEPIQDGMQIHIPRVSEVAQDAPQPGASYGGGTASGSSEQAALVNINTADSATLQTLDGIGPATAQRIIDYRTANGPFGSKEELRQVSGIGEKKYAAIEAHITI